MARHAHAALSRREREIMDILYRRGAAHAGEVLQELSGDVSYSAVRALLRVLESKGHVRHEEKGLRYVYSPTVPRQAARQSALRHLVETFFEGSSGKVMAALIGDERATFTKDELDHLAGLIDKARKAKRR